MSANSKETLELTSRLLEGELDAAGFERLNQLLEQDPEARRVYILAIHIHDQLPDVLLRDIPQNPSSLLEGATPPDAMRADRKLRPAVKIAIGLVAAALLIAAWFAFQRDAKNVLPEEGIVHHPQRAEALDDTVAVVANAVSVDWGDSPPLSSGVGVAPGKISISSGVLHLEFYSGAAVLLEGPATFELRSPSLAVLESGRLRAHVPPESRGFTILSPQATIVDRGTEFGIIAAPDGETQIHVFQGQVDLYPDPDGAAPSPLPNPEEATPAQRLSTGSGALLRPSGDRQPIEAQAERFVTFGEFSDLVDQSMIQRREAWRDFKQSLQQDERIYCWFDFDRTSIRRPRIHGQAPAGALVGALVGCRMATGRWPEETALEFKHPGDRVRFTLAHEFSSVTLMAWVRVDALDRSFSGLLMADGYQVGRPHWQINRRGQIVLGVRTSTRNIYNYKSDAVMGDFALGRWMHLTTVYDEASGVVQHYTNGVLRSSDGIREATLLRFGHVEIGNWHDALGRTRNPVRNLNGRIDEIIVFGTALHEEEIKRIHVCGRP